MAIFFRAHNPLLRIYTFLTSFSFNFLHSAHGIRFVCAQNVAFLQLYRLFEQVLPHVGPRALRTGLIHFQARCHTRWPNLALLLYLCWLIGCFSAFVALGCFCSDWLGRMSLKWFCSKCGVRTLISNKAFFAVMLRVTLICSYYMNISFILLFHYGRPME